MRITDDKLHGRTVLTADGRAIGEVTKLFLQGGQFQIEAIEVKLRKEAADELGVRHGAFKHPLIEVPANLVQSVGDALILSAPLAELRKGPIHRGEEHRMGQPTDEQRQMEQRAHDIEKRAGEQRMSEVRTAEQAVPARATEREAYPPPMPQQAAPDTRPGSSPAPRPGPPAPRR